MESPGIVQRVIHIRIGSDCRCTATVRGRSFVIGHFVELVGAAGRLVKSSKRSLTSPGAAP
jgi:hypothetical protein